MANSQAIGVAYSDQNIVGADIVTATIVYASGQIGYSNTNYSSVTQSNNKSTDVTINTPSGQIITANSQLAPSAQAVFNVNCSSVSIKDNVIISPQSGGTVGAYNIFVAAITNGQFTVVIKNSTNNAYSEALHINYAILHTQT
jgi:hypothetical protein